MSNSRRWTRREWLGASLAGVAVGAVPGRAGAATVLRWATVLPTNHPSVTMMERVAKQVREDTGGSVEIQTFPAGQLGSSRDVIESASSGAMTTRGRMSRCVKNSSALLWTSPNTIPRTASRPISGL